MKEIIQLVILSLATAFCFLGVMFDKQERKYPNEIILITSVLGLIYAFTMGRGFIAVGLCLVMHLIGVFDAMFLRLVKAGDWKMFATLFLFLPLEDRNIFLIFAITLIVLAIITKIMYLRKINFHSIKESFIQEKNALKCLVLLKEHISPNNVLYKAETIPLTLLMFISWISSQIFVLVR